MLPWPTCRSHCSHIVVGEVGIDSLERNQNSMSDHFRDGRVLEETIIQLLERIIDPLHPPFRLLEVAKTKDVQIYTSKDHRRLYCFQELQRRSGRKVKTRVRMAVPWHKRLVSSVWESTSMRFLRSLSCSMRDVGIASLYVFKHVFGNSARVYVLIGDDRS